MAEKQTKRKGFYKAGPGRPKGKPNRVTVEAKAAIEATFTDLNGVAGLTQWARTNPDDFYAKVWVKLLPKNLDITSGGKPLSPEERADRLAPILAALEKRRAGG